MATRRPPRRTRLGTLREAEPFTVPPAERGYGGEALHLPGKTRLRPDRRTERRGWRGGVGSTALRDPEARRDPLALRLPAGVEGRLPVLGGDAGPLARPARAAAGGSGG